MGWLLLAIVVVLFALRVNLILVLMFVAGYTHMVWGAGQLDYFIADIWSAMDRELVLAVPLFILVGSVMSRGSIAKRLVDVMIALTRPIPGGLAVATILSCAVFSAISGSSIVTMLAVGAVLYPALTANGYSSRFSIGALMAGGTLGIIIPPSIPMIIYGIITESSISALFLAGVGPGLLLTVVFSTYAITVNRHIPRERFTISELAKALYKGIPALLMPIILLGGIYSGYFSPTEAAAVALIYAVAIETLFFRELKFRQYFDMTVDAAKLVGALFPLIAIAVSMNLLITEQRIPHHVISFLLEHIESQTGFILLTNVVLLIMGCFMDTASAITIASPLLRPVAEAYGIGVTHLGIIMILNLEIGILTPPLGLNLIVAMTAFKESFGAVCRAALPWVILMIGCLLLVSFQPWIALYLVSG
ncbi:TRAP transporter large permease [Alisedimentitalea sp. MJ-SS2]|uniref:TRAP transporter large permease n=1 Tax=Aliisedimentitalea sp. MJ-SS2 TaxID=3049795 RepID=UPI00290F3A2B|nr:TRAP transporter large permease [Alisedimentitalea sp. MJ-SS2]MDU8929119.1 TRAP transporter large permease [Alisedimentitalea sp. MJ-SS2]